MAASDSRRPERRAAPPPFHQGMDLVNSPTTPTNFFRLFANHIGVKLDAAVYAFLKHALHLVIEPRE